MSSYKYFLLAGAIFAGLSVALGAFGAHGLRNLVSGSHLEIFQTGVRYQMYHALALLFLSLFLREQANKDLLEFAGWAWVAGILLFSGSLYAITLGAPRFFGIVTPFGGVAFLCGWISVILAIINLKQV